MVYGEPMLIEITVRSDCTKQAQRANLDNNDVTSLIAEIVEMPIREAVSREGEDLTVWRQ